MTEADVVQLDSLLRDAGIDLWIDGGWGVDALIGRQTRTHSDLDIVVETALEGRLQSALRALGFADKPREGTRPWNYVLADDRGRDVDVHVITLDEHGNHLWAARAGRDVSRLRTDRGRDYRQAPRSGASRQRI